MKSKLAQLIVWICIFDAASAGADSIVFIVHASNPVTSLTSQELNDYFLKRKKAWPDQTPVRFIDRTESVARKEFLGSVVHKSPGDLDEFWIGQKLYTGDSAPMQSASDGMSIQFVSTFKGAVGYISSSTEVKSKDVKIIDMVRER